MKLKKLCYAASIALAMCLIHTASAQNWTDADGNHLFADRSNWSTLGVAGMNDSATIGVNFDNSNVCIIVTGETESVGTNGNVGSIFGPQWGATLDVYGTLNYGFMMVIAQWDASGPRSTVNVYSGGCLNGLNSGTLLEGDTWWFVSQPYNTLNLYGNGINECAYQSFGSWVNIYDQATNLITTAVDMGPPGSGNWGQGGAVDANRRINVAGGYFICPTGNGQTITNWIGRGIFYVYGKQYDTNEVIITDDGTYT